MFNENIEVTRLNNGVRVVSETVTHVQSVSIGIWVGVGSRHEDKPVRGITHFIEHMLFKGTERRDARQIADEIESRGGSLNAFTDKEYTCYYAKALAENADIVMDLLTDMLRNSKLEPDELHKERNVVLEEIKRYEDTPDDTVHELFTDTLWKRHPLGRPVIGQAKSVGSLERDDLASYIATHYTPERIVVSAAGNISHSEIVKLTEALLGDLTGEPAKIKTFKAVEPSGDDKLRNKRTEQMHFCLGTQGYSQDNDDRYKLTILDMVLGGNMSSRLFQEVREKRGLAYAIGSYNISYADAGFFAVYGGTSPDTFEQVVEISRKEIGKVVKDSLSEDEISKAKTQIKGSLVLGLESMSARMMRMGKSTLYNDRVVPLNEVIEKIYAVDREQIGQIAGELFKEGRMTLAAIGPLKKTVV